MESVKEYTRHNQLVGMLECMHEQHTLLSLECSLVPRLLPPSAQ